VRRDQIDAAHAGYIVIYNIRAETMKTNIHYSAQQPPAHHFLSQGAVPPFQSEDTA